MIYKVEFHVGNTEYEASVDAASGALLYWNSESGEADGDEDDEGEDDD